MRAAVFLLLLTVAYSVESSKILIVFPVTGRSHYILGNALARGLAEAGHDVTMVSPFEDKNPPKNGSYRNVVLTGFLEEREKDNQFNFFNFGDMNVFSNIPFMNFFGSKTTRKTLDNPNLQKLMKSNEQFDVVIVQQFSNDALKALSYHFKAPLILFSTINANYWVNSAVANPAPPSYIPDPLLSYNSDMTFKQRLVNWLFMVACELNRYFIFTPAQNKIMKEYFPDAPDLSILNYNASLVLLNSHESIHQPVPHVPSMIDIGGFHVNPSKELPKDLKDYLDSATEGVVYFSLGSNLKPSQMTEDKRDAILRALGKIKQKVLWKWDEDTLPGQPSNVKLSKWFPQQDILAHPNVKLFITHGGLLSTIETIYHGVPILAFPVFGDQKTNAATAQDDGYAISVPYTEISESKINDALNRLLNHPEYRDNAKRRSQLLHDRPINPLDLAVYWTEFVIRHKGAPHLRVAGLDLPWYKYLLLDVISFVAFIVIGSIYLIYFVVKKLCCKGKRNEKKLKAN